MADLLNLYTIIGWFIIWGVLGAIDAERFKHLIRRYLFVADEFPVDDVSQVSSSITDGFGLFVFCAKFDGTDNLNHAIRIIGITGDDYNIAIPAFPHGTSRNASPNTIKVDWLGAVCIRIKPLGS